MKIKLIFKWYDLWIGFFYDKKKRYLYFLPIPMIGVIIQLPETSSNLSPMTDPDIVEKMRKTRNKTIQRDRTRLKIGLPPLTKMKLKDKF